MNQHFEGPHNVDRDDPLTFFDSEQDIADFSSSSKATTFSALAEFGEESYSAADNGPTPAAPLDVRVEPLAGPANVEAAAAPPTILQIAAVALPKVETAAVAGTEHVPARAHPAARERKTVTAPMGTGARRRATVSASPSAETDERAVAASLARSKALERAMATASTGAARRRRPTAAPVSSRVRWVISLAVLVPPAATLLVFGTPLLSTAGLDRGIPGTTVAGTASIQQEANRELAAMLPSAPAPSSAPHVTDPVVTEALNEAVRTEPIVLAATDERRQPAAQGSSQPAASPRRSSAAVTQAGSVRLASAAAPRPQILSTVPAAAIGADPIPPLAARPASAFPTQTPYRRGFQSVISVDTGPGGAHVFVDGRYVGVTPVVWDVAAGSHVVRIEREGYERWSGAVQAVAEKTVNVAVKLLPTRQQ
jgi:PEGA domain